MVRLFLVGFVFLLSSVADASGACNALFSSRKIYTLSELQGREVATEVRGAVEWQGSSPSSRHLVSTGNVGVPVVRYEDGRRRYGETVPVEVGDWVVLPNGISYRVRLIVLEIEKSESKIILELDPDSVAQVGKSERSLPWPSQRIRQVGLAGVGVIKGGRFIQLVDGSRLRPGDIVDVSDTSWVYGRHRFVVTRGERLADRDGRPTEIEVAAIDRDGDSLTITRLPIEKLIRVTTPRESGPRLEVSVE